MCAYTLSHPHHSSPHTNILASLVKGEVLSPEKIRATTGGIASSPSLACTNPPNPALSLAPHHVLASPRKRGGGTAVEVFRLAVQYSDSPAFTILKLFRAVTVGIVNALEAFMIALLSISISYAPSSLSKTTLSLALHHHPCLPCQREVD